MVVNIPKESIIACICEGGAETAIMDILLDNDMLIFNRDQLIDEAIIPRTTVKEFQRKYLNVDYGCKIIILRVIDSRNEQFNLGKVYSNQIEVIDVITAPEIEMLIIASEGKYNDFCKSKEKKPSDYCKNILRIKNVKSPKYIHDYFSDQYKLIDSIKEYHRLHNQKKNEATIYDLLKDEYK